MTQYREQANKAVQNLIVKRIGRISIKNDDTENLTRIAEDQAARVLELEAAAYHVIKMNRQHALDEYGNADKAESWACVTVLRKALEAQ